MESVEDLVVTVAADLVLVIDKTIMDVLLRNELRQHCPVLGKNGLKSVQLRLLLSIYPHPVAFFEPFPDVGGEKLEILVERWLR